MALPLHSSMMNELALKHENSVLTNVTIVFSGTILLSLLAQVSFPLPFTPVPITGQTFGVALIGLLWGQNRGIASVFLYLLVGAVGLPVFTQGRAGLTWGPTLGYLIGMCVASAVVGSLADRGWSRTFLKAWAAATLGSVLIFSFGLLGLSYFVPSEQLLTAGLLPFLPGDLLKNSSAAFISSRANKKLGGVK